MPLLETLKKQRERRKRRVRNKVNGTAQLPRLTVFKSLRYLSCQIIDDTTGSTLVSASTLEKELKKGKNLSAAKLIGKTIGDRAKAKNILRVVFDRNGYPYHGRIKAIADSAREAGLQL